MGKERCVMAEVRATMAGNVWKVEVKEGETVFEGQEVVILESMKMEIPITAEASGVVQSIKVEEGSFVNENDVLLVIE